MSAPTAPPVLQVRDLVVEYEGRGERVQAVRGVSFDVHAGEVVALVGESGSGKSTTAHAVVGLLPGGGRVVGGSVRLHDGELVGLTAKAWQQVRGARIGLVPQDPGIALNPVARIGDQVAEVLRIHGRVRRAAAAQQAVEILRSVGLSDPEARARQYPHELSGGMRQRVLIGIALALEPALVIADEPTSALDVTVQRRVLDLLDDLTSRTGSAVLFITHDLAVAADRADRVVVMKDGEIVEQGLTAQVLGAPSHPYTRSLLAAAPQLAVRERVAPPAPSVGESPLLDVLSVSKTFRLPGHAGRTVQAVDDVSFSVPRGGAFGLVGESGSGKSTIARLVLQLTTPDSGTVLLDGAPVVDAGRPRAPAPPVAAGAPEPVRVAGPPVHGRQDHRRAPAVAPRGLPVAAAGPRGRAARAGRPRCGLRVASSRRAVGRPAAAGRDRPRARARARTCWCSTSRPARSTSRSRRRSWRCSTGCDATAA